MSQVAGRPGAAGTGLILVAAGRGTRLGAGVPKALVPLGHGVHEAPIVVHALRAALRCRALVSVVVVAPRDPEGLRQLALAVAGVTPPEGVQVRVVPGGAERSDSVALGLAALGDDVDVVLVHDAARALTPVDVFDRVVQAVRSGHDAVTPALPVTDTIKQVAAGEDVEGPDSTETVVATVDRATLRAVQTPQGFRRETLERAHREFGVASRAASATDDCGMVEALGGTVAVVPGSPRAMKITTPHDLELASAWLLPDRPSPVGAPAPTEPTACPRPGPVLIVLSGRPGVGKTSIARELCRRVGAAHLRGDTVEQGLVRGGVAQEQLGAQGYGVAYAVAADQLAVGLSVVADMVNGVDVARRAWEQVAERAGARLSRVMVECSDGTEHRHRVERRKADIEGHQLPGWEQSRRREVAPWPEAEVCLDTATTSVAEAVSRIVAALEDRP